VKATPRQGKSAPYGKALASCTVHRGAILAPVVLEQPPSSQRAVIICHMHTQYKLQPIELTPGPGLRRAQRARLDPWVDTRPASSFRQVQIRQGRGARVWQILQAPLENSTKVVPENRNTSAPNSAGMVTREVAEVLRACAARRLVSSTALPDAMILARFKPRHTAVENESRSKSSNAQPRLCRTIRRPAR